jgi:hypothetical protein
MKRVRDETVLARAIEDAVAAIDGTYAIAARYDAAADRYIDVKLNTGVFVDLRTGALLVKRSRAERDVTAPLPTAGGHGAVPRATGDGAVPDDKASVGARARPTKFYGTITLDPTRPGPLVAQIAQSVLAELARASGATIKLSIDIQAENPSGFPEDVVEVIRANAETLKFRESGFD